MFHTDSGVQEDDHPCSWVHFKYATDILAPLIKRTAKPLKELSNETIEANAKEWSKFYKSKENVASLGMVNDFTMKRPNLLWVNTKDIPPKPDMHDFKYIEPWI